MEKTCLHYSSECPLWVINGLFAATLRMSVIGGKADIILTTPSRPGGLFLE